MTLSKKPERDCDSMEVRLYNRGWNDAINASTPTPAQQQEPVDESHRDAQEAPFEAWWETQGQYLRAGGGQYEKTFAWHAWCAAAPQPAQQEPLATFKDEVIGYFNAAFVEGLQEALAETQDEHLKDLVERRLMYALYAAQEIEGKK